MAINAELVTVLRQNGIGIHSFAKLLISESNAGTSDAFFWDGVGELVYDGDTYVGVGSFGGVSYGEEKLSEPAQPFSLRINGSAYRENGEIVEIPRDNFLNAITDTLEGVPIQGRPCEIFIAVTDGRSIVTLPSGPAAVIGRANGTLDVIRATEDDRGYPSLEVSVEDETFVGQISIARHLAPEDHNVDYPSSTYLVMTPIIESVDTKWGAAGS